jgi:LemA protein
MGWMIAAGVLFVLLGIVGYVVGIYNQLIRIRHNVDKAWANIDVLLKQRHDELPKLVDTCKGYMQHERGLLEAVTKARTDFMSATGIAGKTMAENQLAGALKSVFAVAENYPELKANQNFMQLQSRISGLENDIADRREFFNESTNIYNIRIQQFPQVLIAGPMGYAQRPLLEIPKAETQDVDIKF